MLVKLADALGTSVNYLLTGNPVEGAQLASSRPYCRFQALEGLAEGDRKVVIRAWLPSTDHAECDLSLPDLHRALTSWNEVEGFRSIPSWS